MGLMLEQQVQRTEKFFKHFIPSLEKEGIKIFLQSKKTDLNKTSQFKELENF